MIQIHDLSARQVMTGFQDRSLSPADYLQALIARIEALELRLWALWLFRPEQALSEARAAETRYLWGNAQGRLDGMPVSLKELIATTGDHVPQGTSAIAAPVAARLRENGAIIYAKTICSDDGMLISGLSLLIP